MSYVLIGLLSGALFVISIVMLLQGVHGWKGPVFLIMAIWGFYYALAGVK